MADPKLKTVAPAGAPRRVLLNSGAVPTRRVTLKGADGRTIGPKAPAPTPAPAPAPVAEEPVVATEPAVDEEALRAQQEYEQQMAEYNRQMEEYNRQMAEYEAQQKAEAEAAAAAEAAAKAEAEARAAAEAEAAARAAEEAAAAAAAAEETAAVVEAPTPVAVPKPVAGPKLAVKKPAGPKLAVAKPAGAPAAGLKPSVAKPAPKPALAAKPAPKPALAPKPAAPTGTALPPGTPPPPAPVEEPAEEYTEEAPQMTQAEIEQQNAYYEMLQAQANKTPFHKKPIFFVACGILLAGAIAAICVVQSSESDRAAIEARRKAEKDILYRAIEINQKEVFTLEDARSKNVDIKCSKQDAELLLHIILNYDEKDETGYNRWGDNPVGTAKFACVLLGLASEQSPDICNMVFKTLADNATKMHPELLDELLDRLTKTNIKKLNSKLNALAKPLSPKDDAEVLTVIWTYKERLATKKDVDKVLDILKLKELDGGLDNAMRAYMLSLFKKMDNMDDRTAIGKQVWDISKGNDDKLGSQNIMRMLAFSCVPEALTYYKGKMEDTKNWKKYGYFFGSWQQDEIVTYLNELRGVAGDDEKLANTIDSIIMKVLTQDRPRSVEDAKNLLNMAYDDFNTDTSRMQELIIKLDENPEDTAAQEEYDKLDRIFIQKERVIKNLANCKEYHDWIDAILNDIEAECNATHNSQRHNKLAKQVNQTREKIKENELKNAASTTKHAKRMELED